MKVKDTLVCVECDEVVNRLSEDTANGRTETCPSCTSTVLVPLAKWLNRDLSSNNGDASIRSGAHLAVVRSWIQTNCRNGDTVHWGSEEFLESKPLTVRDMERLSQQIADATLKFRV